MPEFEGHSLKGTSPVKVLRLIECSAQEDTLSAVLSWLQKLRELYYNIEQNRWLRTYYNYNPWTLWECSPFSHALQSQKESPEYLAFTQHEPTIDPELGYGPAIDLKDFPSLKTLNIYHTFLTGDEPESEAWRHLPRNLEALEVFYDDPETDCLTEEQPFPPEDLSSLFLMYLPQHKAWHFLKLQ